MNLGDRSRLRLLDVLIKKYGWRTLALVGVHDDGEVRGLLQWCRHLKLTAVWQPKAAHLSERQRQMHARDRMRKWVESYGRLTLVEHPQHEAVETLAGRSFDAVALWGLSPGQLAATGASWAALVRDGGALVGRDHRTAEVRRILNAAVPKWRSLRDGVWLVEVKRTVESGQAAAVDNLDAAAVADADDAAAVGEGHAVVGDLVEDGAAVVEGALAGTHLGAVHIEQMPETVADRAHDPVDSGSGADDAVRPRISIHIGHLLASGAEGDHAENVAQPAPKRRGGRPKGSRNKPKVAAE